MAKRTDNQYVCEYCTTVNYIPEDARTLECAKCGAPLRTKFASGELKNLDKLVSFPAQMSALLSPTAVSEVNGMDVSYYQGQINWDVAMERIQAAYARSSAGNAYIDPTWMVNLTACQERGLPIGPYHFCKPDKDAIKSANNFKDAGEGDLPPVADIETNAGLSKNALENWVLKFLWRVEDLFGVRPMIYTSAGFWNQYMPRTSWAKDYKLWVAHWTTAANPLLPNDWVSINNPRTWTLWQYSANGNNLGSQYGVQSRDIDLWRYNGTVAEFNEEFGVTIPSPQPPPPPPPPPLPVAIVISGVGSGNFLNMRAAPYGTVVAKTWDNTKFDVMGAETDADGKIWYQVGKTIYVASWFTKPV